MAGKVLNIKVCSPLKFHLSLSGVSATLTVGSTEAPSPYEIDAIIQGMDKTGATVVIKTIEEISVDTENKIVTAPCYMMEADILQIRNNVQKAIGEFP